MNRFVLYIRRALSCTIAAVLAAGIPALVQAGSADPEIRSDLTDVSLVYEISPSADNGAGDPVKSGYTVCTEDGVAPLFEGMSFEPGTYKYRVVPVPPEEGIYGISYDCAVKEITVTADDSGMQVSSIPEYHDLDGQLSVDAAPSVHLDGQIEDGMFSFELVPVDAVYEGLGGFEESSPSDAKVGPATPADVSDRVLAGPGLEGTESVPPMPVGSTTATNTKSGFVCFGSITYTQPGVYRYEIRPQEEDWSACTVTVEITESDGVLCAAVSYGGNGNLYAVEAVPEEEPPAGEADPPSEGPAAGPVIPDSPKDSVDSGEAEPEDSFGFHVSEDLYSVWSKWTPTGTQEDASVGMFSFEDANSSPDLGEFLESIEVFDQDGNPVTEENFRPGEKYNFKLKFKEPPEQEKIFRPATDEELKALGLTDEEIANGPWMYVELGNDVTAEDGTVSSDGKVRVAGGGRYLLVKYEGDETQQMDQFDALPMSKARGFLRFTRGTLSVYGNRTGGIWPSFSEFAWAGY